MLTFLFHNERMGLNAIIAALSFVGFTFMEHRAANRTILSSGKWSFAAVLFIVNAFSVYFSHSGLAFGLFYLSLFYFAAINYNTKLSLPLGLAQSVQSFFTGFYYIFHSTINHFKNKKSGQTQKGLIRFILFLAPLIIGVIFLKLYQNADETFAEWTAFINLDWISWSFIGLYILFTFLLFGIYHLRGIQEVDATESRLKNTILSGYSDRIQQFLGIINERKIATSLLITLISLLVLYNMIDLRFLFIELPNPSPGLRYSDLLHGGVNSLMTSIILVILIVTFIFRGELNFQRNKFVKILTLIWLALNGLMILTTAVKNYEYISHWGLTYKRIGVYIYLALAIGGLVFTFIKVLYVKSFWYLLRNTSLTFLVGFTIVGAVNWNKIIVRHNLQLPISQIDFDYLYDLGPDTYPDMLKYYNNHATQLSDNLDFWQRLGRNFNWTKAQLETKSASYSWKSSNYRETQLLAEMQQVNLITPIK